MDEMKRMRSRTRREFLQTGGAGFGALALHALLGAERAGASPQGGVAGNPLAPRASHFPARAKRVIHLFMNGGPSQVDTFDRKVALDKYEGKELPIHYDTERKTGVAFKSPFAFDRYGESGIEVSELFKETAAHVDDMCLIRSMHCSVPNHPPSFMEMNCGDIQQSRPSMGSWINYGLGSENENLPGFVSMCPGGYPSRYGPRNWQSSFLPAAFQGTYVNTEFTKIEELIDNIRNPSISFSQQRAQLDLLRALHEEHAEEVADEGPLEARIQSFDLAYRMQMEAADVFDVSKEPGYVRERYGDSVHGRQLMIARRLVERGVRFVQVWTGKGIPWDAHDDIMDHEKLAKDWDRPIAALLSDLKERGLLEDTLVIWGGEFGRTPTVELPAPGTNKGVGKGRDHNNHGFTVWMAGGGVKGGHVHGATDEFGFKAVENRVHVHDLHATILHLLGLDHEKLTYRYAGRDFRLTDVHGNVVREILA
jgi:hypothetical protein